MIDLKLVSVTQRFISLSLGFAFVPDAGLIIRVLESPRCYTHVKISRINFGRDRGRSGL